MSDLLAFRTGAPNIADKDSKTSVTIAHAIFEQLNISAGSPRTGQGSGTALEQGTRQFIETRLRELVSSVHWLVETNRRIENFEQYGHLAQLDDLIKNDETGTLRTTIGTDYSIKPDVTVGIPIDRSELPLLHASISCKFTIRSDRVQNIRHEGVLLTRNRRGRQPHIVALTCEPLPSRLAGIARGTGEIDCVYHVALPQLQQATAAAGYEQQDETLKELVDQKRLLDITELPLVLADVAHRND